MFCFVMKSDINWSDFPRLLSEVSAFSGDELVVMDASSWRPTTPPVSKCISLVDDYDMLFACPDAVVSNDDGSFSSSEASSSSKTTNSSASPPRSPRPSKRVSFSTVEIREYGLTIGVHPCCRDGLPIMLDWKYVEKSTILDVELVWKIRENRVPHRSSSKKCVRRLDYYERLQRLQQVTDFCLDKYRLKPPRRSKSRKDKVR